MPCDEHDGTVVPEVHLVPQFAVARDCPQCWGPLKTQGASKCAAHGPRGRVLQREVKNY